jgi:guanylate kinase
MNQKRSNVFIISAPSGAGKSTLIQRLLTEKKNLFFSISHTTRQPREGEQHGVDYFFISEKEFEEKIDRQEMLEWAEVHDALYGTSREMLTKAQQLNRDLILDIDVQGAHKVKQILSDAVSIFILPPSIEALRNRLRLRAKNTEEQIAIRVENARKEIQYCNEYDYVIINHDIDAAYEDLTCILSSQGHKKENQQQEIDTILRSFQQSGADASSA